MFEMACGMKSGQILLNHVTDASIRNMYIHQIQTKAD